MTLSNDIRPIERYGLIPFCDHSETQGFFSSISGSVGLFVCQRLLVFAVYFSALTLSLLEMCFPLISSDLSNADQNIAASDSNYIFLLEKRELA